MQCVCTWHQHPAIGRKAGRIELTFFTVAAAWDMSILPTRVDPVKPIFRTASDFISSSAANGTHVSDRMP